MPNGDSVKKVIPSTLRIRALNSTEASILKLVLESFVANAKVGSHAADPMKTMISINFVDSLLWIEDIG